MTDVDKVISQMIGINNGYRKMNQEFDNELKMEREQRQADRYYREWKTGKKEKTMYQMFAEIAAGE